MKLKSWWRTVREAEIEPKNELEQTWMNEKWFEACRCFHILKEINICIYSDCTVLLQINNHNHKRPGDWLSIELSFFSLWQIWILLLQGSQMTLLLWCVYVYMCSFICVLSSFKFHLSQWSMCVIWSVWGKSCVYRLEYLSAMLTVCAAKGGKHQATVIESSFWALKSWH